MIFLPEDAFADVSFTEDIFPGKTYAMDWDAGRVRGYADDLEAVRQSIARILSTERCAWPAYSANYGVELTGLFGMPASYVLPELKRRIREALTWDSRIDAVDDFDFSVDGNRVRCAFTARTIYGDLDARTEVTI